MELVVNTCSINQINKVAALLKSVYLDNYIHSYSHHICLTFQFSVGL
jgi:hypothetical protein